MPPPPISAPAPRRGLLLWIVYAAVAVTASALVARYLPMWFRDDDGAFLGFAAHHPVTDAFVPGTGAVQTFYRPISVAFFALAYRFFGLTYWPYQFTQILLTFGIWAAFYAMLRQLWGRWKPALAATILHPLLFASLYYFNFRFSQVNYQLEALLGFSAIALAAWGWRRRSLAALLGGLLLTELAYGAKEPSCVYLPILHAYAAMTLGRQSPIRWRWIVVYLAVGAAMTAGHLLLVRSHFSSFGGASNLTFDYIFARVSFYSRLLTNGATGIALMVLTGMACLGQTMRMRRLGSWRGPLSFLAGSAGVEVYRFVHPLVPVAAISLAAAQALPFGLAAAVLLALITQLKEMWTIYLLQASWMFLAALVGAIAFSPLPASLATANAWSRRRLHLDLRVPALVLVLAAGGLAAYEGRGKLLALQVTSDRRAITRDLTRYVAQNLPTGATLAIAQWRDLGTTHEQQHALGEYERSRQLIQWYNRWYWNILDVFGRGDIVATYVDGQGVTQAINYEFIAESFPHKDVYAMTTGNAETQAVERLLDGRAKAVFSVKAGDEEGRIYHVFPAAATAPASSRSP